MTWLPLEKQKRCAPRQSMPMPPVGMLCAKWLQLSCFAFDLHVQHRVRGPEHFLALHCKPTKERPYREGEFCFLSACGQHPHGF